MDQHHGAAMEAIQPRGVVHFSIAVSDLEASRKFYTEVLGLKQIFHAPEFKMVFLMAGKDYVILCKSETPIHPNPQGQRRVHHAFAVDPASYDSAKTILQQNGIAIIDEENRTTGIFTGRQMYFHDPDRNVLELTEWQGKEY
jgi:catechol 2,3-dioxygenase-like lactoylglutathione lyase family enzyme